MDEDVHMDVILGGSYPTGAMESVPPESFTYPLDIDDIYYIECWPTGRSQHGGPTATAGGNDRITQAWQIHGGGVPRRGWGRWTADGGSPLGHDTRIDGDEPGRFIWEREFRTYALINDGFAYNHSRPGTYPHVGYGGHMCFFPEEYEFAAEYRWRTHDCRLLPMGGYRAYGLSYSYGYGAGSWWPDQFLVNPF